MRNGSPIGGSIASGLPGNDQQHVAEQPERGSRVQEPPRHLGERSPSVPLPAGGGTGSLARNDTRSRASPAPGHARPRSKDTADGLAEQPRGVIRVRRANDEPVAGERRRKL